MAVSYLSCRPLSHRRVGPLPGATLSTTTTFSTSLFPSASLSTRAYLSTYLHRSTLRTHSLFLSPSLSRSTISPRRDKCKTKTYLPYSLCKYAGTATQGGPEFFLRFRSRFPRHASHLLHVSPAVVYSTIFAILLTIIRIRRSANGYGREGGVVRLQLGRVVLLFRDRLLVNSGTVAPARISRLRLLRRALARENMYLYRGGLRDKAKEEV